jgi:hypothetical protein
MLRGEIDAVNTPAINQLPCLATCRKSLCQYLALSYIHPLRNAGNRAATREIKGGGTNPTGFLQDVEASCKIV